MRIRFLFFSIQFKNQVVQKSISFSFSIEGSGYDIEFKPRLVMKENFPEMEKHLILLVLPRKKYSWLQFLISCKSEESTWWF
ncbi:hypothetical protein D0X99_15810 [Algoriphagus lacus]|uniref:Uncharacterized protein n=1 Tax=Algoriphagus lacus TaxID=2056311 RepID=A0A418PP52_9BACT|nr:hypothetical protein D0X99_15810 [Algoriphagus lacus]